MHAAELPLVEFERLLISKIDEIKKAGNGKITRKVINAVLGVDENDKKTVETIRKKLRNSRCFKGRGGFYRFLVEEVMDMDATVIESDPELSIMESIVKSVGHLFTFSKKGQKKA